MIYDLLIYNDGIHRVKSSDEYGRQKIWRENEGKPFLWLKNHAMSYSMEMVETLEGFPYEIVSKESFINALKDVHFFFTDERLTDVVSFELYSASEANSNYLRKRVRQHSTPYAWVEILEDGIRIGSAVPDYDYDCDPFELSYPFTYSELEEELEKLITQYKKLKLEAEQNRDKN